MVEVEPEWSADALAFVESDPPPLAGELTWSVVLHEATDDSVYDDLEYLSDGASYSLDDPSSGLNPSADIVVEYLGKGAPVGEDVVWDPDYEEGTPDVEADTPWESWTGANLASRNIFRVNLKKSVLSSYQPPQQEADSNHQGLTPSDRFALNASGDIDPDESRTVLGPDMLAAPSDPQAAWSNNYDSRVQVYGTQSPVSGVNRWQIQLLGAGSGGVRCSGGLVGSRHFLTAAHCVTPGGGGGSTWLLEGATVTLGRNGATNLGVVTMTSNPPPGEVSWWWTPSGWLSTGSNKDDFAIVTTPGSFGCPAYGGQCAFSFASHTPSDLQNHSIYSRGYPRCDPFQSRIDEPCQNTSQNPSSCSNYGTWACTTTCRNSHLYGQSAACGWGSFLDNDLRFSHGCDVSAGDSGASIFFYSQTISSWTLAGVHTFSDCGKQCSESCAGLTHPAKASRITSGRASMISFFITNWPNY